MKTRAAIAWGAGQKLEIDEIDLAGPKAGEVLIRQVATGVCHTDAYTLSGADPEGIFPSILGHEGGRRGRFIWRRTNTRYWIRGSAIW